MELSDLVDDGIVRAAASMFPVEVKVQGTGYATSRFILAKSPDDEWYAMAWRLDGTGQPVQFVFEPVSSISKFTTAMVVVSTDRGNVIVTPSSGGCCGNRLKSYNPFGASVKLARVAVTDEEKHGT